MGVIGDQRPARGRAIPCGSPGVGGTCEIKRFERRQRRGIKRDIGSELRQAGGQLRIFGQGGDAATGGVGQDVGQALLVGQRERGAGALDLGIQMPRQLQGHQLDQRDGIRGAPGGDRGIKQQHFGGTATQGFGVDLIQPGIHPGGIGIQRCAGLGVERLKRLHRQGIKIKATQQTVDTDGGGAENLGQAALDRAAHGDHLPQTVLRMGKAQPVEHILVTFPEDMRHIGVVAHDLHLGPEVGHADRIVVVWQRPRGQPIGTADTNYRQHHQERCNSHQPPKNHCHVTLLGISTRD